MFPNLGAVLAGLGRVEEAERMMEQARDIGRAHGDLVVWANAVVNLGHTALTDGRLDEAEALLVEGRVLQRDLHQPGFEATAAGNLGVVAFERGRIRKARQLLDEAICTFRALGQKRALALYGGVFGAVLAASGELDRARREFRAGRRLLEELGDTETLRAVFSLSASTGLPSAGSRPSTTTGRHWSAGPGDTATTPTSCSSCASSLCIRSDTATASGAFPGSACRRLRRRPTSRDRVSPRAGEEPEFAAVSALPRGLDVSS